MSLASSRHVLAAVCLLAACSAPAPPHVDAAEQLPLRVLVVHESLPYAPGPAATRLVRSASEWDAKFRELTDSISPRVEIDWSTEVAVVVAGPAYTSGPTEVTFDRALRYQEFVRLEYHFRFPEMRNDYGSRPLAAVALSRRLLGGRSVRIHALAPDGDVPTLAPPTTALR